MTLDTKRYQEILTPLHSSPLSPTDAEVIVELAQIVLDADGREDADEIKTFFALGKAVFAMAGLAEAPTPSFASGDEDDERMRELATKLTTPAAKELAFACAHLLSISDVDIAPEEDLAMANLRDALDMSQDAAEALVAQLNAAITPPG